ncbi:MAG: hypothetical protein ACOCV2_07680 [Persicimonas sp.]
MITTTLRRCFVFVSFVAVLGIAAPATSGDEAASDQEESSQEDARALLSEASEIAHTVSRIRGLALKDEIDKGVRDREELREVLLDRLDEEVGDRDIENEARVFKQLDLLPADLDYKETLLDVLTEQIAGFYDQAVKELYIMKGIPLELQRPAMAHEIFHAIQDQHFDLQRLVEPIKSKENGDFALARSSMVEGDATILMLDFSLYETGQLPAGGIESVIDMPGGPQLLRGMADQGLGALTKMSPPPEEAGAESDETMVDPAQLDQSSLSKAPRVIRKLLVFPYFAGLKFIVDARKDAEWERVDQIYERAPTSTEQILHPERYFADDDPVHLDFVDQPIDEIGEPVYDSVLGEYQMRLVFEQQLLGEDGDRQEAQQEIDRALTGWGGDRVRAWDLEDGDLLLSHLSTWDTLTDAEEYFEALVELVRRRYPGSEIAFDEGEHGASACLVVEGDDGDAERVYVERWGDLVLHIEGAPSELDEEGRERNPTTHRLRERIMESVERTDFERVLEERLAEFDRQREDANEPDNDDDGEGESSSDENSQEDPDGTDDTDDSDDGDSDDES